MKTPLSQSNPFNQTVRLEQAYVWERLNKLFIKKGPLRILDYGTYDGQMLQIIANTGIIDSAIGVDVNVSAIESTPLQNSLVTLQVVSKGKPLPFPDECFDVVTLVGVLEHIHRQDLVLAELNRVLSNDGKLLISVPRQHLFSFLDLGNLKFRFPRIHRKYFIYRNSEEDYIRRYVEGQNGLIGDVEIEKHWHEHFTQNKLEALLAEAGFMVLKQDGFGYFFRVFHNLHHLSPIFKKALHNLMLRDMFAFEKSELFVECEKAKWDKTW